MSKVSFPVSGVWDYSGGASIVGGYPAGGGGGGGSNDTVRLGGTGVADTSSGGKSGIAGPSGVGTKVTGFSAKEVLQKNSRYGKPEPYLEWRAVKGLVQTIRGGYTLGLFDSEHAQCLKSPCVLCVIPTGEGWGEDELRRRIQGMGDGVGRSMYALRTFIAGGMTCSDDNTQDAF